MALFLSEALRAYKSETVPEGFWGMGEGKKEGEKKGEGEHTSVCVREGQGGRGKSEMYVTAQ